jgi:hypothetical protein
MRIHKGAKWHNTAIFKHSWQKNVLGLNEECLERKTTDFFSFTMLNAIRSIYKPSSIYNLDSSSKSLKFFFWDKYKALDIN